MEVVKVKWEAISHEREQENHDRDANSATSHKKETQPEFFDPFDLTVGLIGIISP
jgi:hypothetical protein